jgi:uncharacterized protein (DUF342 family)
MEVRAMEIITWEEFKEAQGCPYRHLGDNRMVFENGSVWQFGGTPGSCVFAADQKEMTDLDKTTMRIQFQEDLVKHLEATFQRIKKVMTEQAEIHAMGAGPPPTEEDFDALNKCRHQVIKARERLHALRSQLTEVKRARGIPEEKPVETLPRIPRGTEGNGN